MNTSQKNSNTSISTNTTSAIPITTSNTNYTESPVNNTMNNTLNNTMNNSMNNTMKNPLNNESPMTGLHGSVSEIHGQYNGTDIVGHQLPDASMSAQGTTDFSSMGKQSLTQVPSTSIPSLSGRVSMKINAREAKEQYQERKKHGIPWESNHYHMHSMENYPHSCDYHNSLECESTTSPGDQSPCGNSCFRGVNCVEMYKEQGPFSPVLKNYQSSHLQRESMTYSRQPHKHDEDMQADRSPSNHWPQSLQQPMSMKVDSLKVSTSSIRNDMKSDNSVMYHSFTLRDSKLEDSKKRGSREVVPLDTDSRSSYTAYAREPSEPLRSIDFKETKFEASHGTKFEESSVREKMISDPLFGARRVQVDRLMNQTPATPKSSLKYPNSSPQSLENDTHPNRYSLPKGNHLILSPRDMNPRTQNQPHEPTKMEVHHSFQEIRLVPRTPEVHDTNKDQISISSIASPLTPASPGSHVSAYSPASPRSQYSSVTPSSPSTPAYHKVQISPSPIHSTVPSSVPSTIPADVSTLYSPVASKSSSVLTDQPSAPSSTSHQSPIPDQSTSTAKNYVPLSDIQSLSIASLIPTKGLTFVASRTIFCGVCGRRKQNTKYLEYQNSLLGVLPESIKGFKIKICESCSKLTLEEALDSIQKIQVKHFTPFVQQRTSHIHQILSGALKYDPSKEVFIVKDAKSTGKSDRRGRPRSRTQSPKSTPRNGKSSRKSLDEGVGNSRRNTGSKKSERKEKENRVKDNYNAHDIPSNTSSPRSPVNQTTESTMQKSIITPNLLPFKKRLSSQMSPCSEDQHEEMVSWKEAARNLLSLNASPSHPLPQTHSEVTEVILHPSQPIHLTTNNPSVSTVLTSNASKFKMDSDLLENPLKRKACDDGLDACKRRRIDDIVQNE